MQIDMTINGLPVKAEYSKQDIETIFQPLLADLRTLQKEKGGRIVAFLAAPPGLGKSTLAAFLEYLSLQDDNPVKVQAAGMDGFHRYASYLKSHTMLRDGEEILMDAVKGAPETFDAERLGLYLEKLLSEKELLWPTYDRTLHDVVDEGPLLKEDIIFLEGNYLLLSDARWQVLRKYAAYKIYASADIELLKPRLVERKVMSGYSSEAAEAFYAYSDGRNAELILNDVPEDADLLLRYTENGWEKTTC